MNANERIELLRAALKRIVKERNHSLDLFIARDALDADAAMATSTPLTARQKARATDLRILQLWNRIQIDLQRKPITVSSNYVSKSIYEGVRTRTGQEAEEYREHADRILQRLNGIEDNGTLEKT